jgi:hypothetical protein
LGNVLGQLLCYEKHSAVLQGKFLDVTRQKTLKMNSGVIAGLIICFKAEQDVLAEWHFPENRRLS